MGLFRKLCITLTFLFLISIVLPSCSNRSREAVCKGNSNYRSQHPKKNKSGYNQKYSYKTRSVRKDYVIKNGIAH